MTDDPDTLGAYYRQAPIPKPEPRVVTKTRQAKLDAKDERACREIVRRRDAGKCRIPGCTERVSAQHHVQYRSRAKGLRFDPENVISLCAEHHALRHAGVIHIAIDDGELVITGDTERLKFRL